jgi:hypothetical protein
VRSLIILVVVVMTAGCDAKDERPATWSYISATIITPNCATSGCHSRLAATYGLQLDTKEGAYQDLVGGGYVVPGDPTESKLMWLLTGTEVVTRMPPDNPLPDADIELVRRWIEDGAKPE